MQYNWWKYSSGSAGVAVADMTGPQPVFVEPIGLNVALVSLCATVKGGELYTINKQIELYCEKAIKTKKWQRTSN